ncbi:type 1 fimbrial protein [Serratia ureilytica]|uniref:fimbrial protein n=1 Tax=Serratia ureilytica TaxID=300181 RepID=UPI00313EE081
MKKSLIALSMLGMAAVSTAYAAGGGGKVTFTGSIIDAPCSIAPGSLDQTVNLGGISNVALAANGNTGTSTAIPFNIELQGCVINTAGTKDKVTVTFSGAPSAYDAESLGLIGSAKGAYVQLAQADGTKVKLNTATTAQTVLNGANTLAFSANLKGSGVATVAVEPGDFQVPANFVLDYN